MNILIKIFDEDIHDLLKNQLAAAEKRLNKIARLFWLLTKHQLKSNASFNDEVYRFQLKRLPEINQDTASGSDVLASYNNGVALGNYELIQKGVEPAANHHVYRLNHPLGEHVVDTAKLLKVPKAKVQFNYSDHPTKVSSAADLLGQSGLLVLNKLSIHSFQEEEHLLFTALNNNGGLVEQEVCEKLFTVFGEQAALVNHTDEELLKQLEETEQRQIAAKVSQVLEANNSYFQQERDRLEKWADDKVAGAEQDLLDTKAKIKTLKRESKLAQTLEEQKAFQEKIKEDERKQRKQRQTIFDVEDEILEKRDELIDALEKRLNQKTETEHLFIIQWQVV